MKILLSTCAIVLALSTGAVMAQNQDCGDYSTGCSYQDGSFTKTGDTNQNQTIGDHTDNTYAPDSASSSSTAVGAYREGDLNNQDSNTNTNTSTTTSHGGNSSANGNLNNNQDVNHNNSSVGNVSNGGNTVTQTTNGGTGGAGGAGGDGGKGGDATGGSADLSNTGNGADLSNTGDNNANLSNGDNNADLSNGDNNASNDNSNSQVGSSKNKNKNGQTQSASNNGVQNNTQVDARDQSTTKYEAAASTAYAAGIYGQSTAPCVKVSGIGAGAQTVGAGWTFNIRNDRESGNCITNQRVGMISQLYGNNDAAALYLAQQDPAMAATIAAVGLPSGRQVAVDNSKRRGNPLGQSTFAQPGVKTAPAAQVCQVKAGTTRTIVTNWADKMACARQLGLTK